MLASQSDGLTVTLPRDEIEAALASDPPNELVLDIFAEVEGTDEPEDARSTSLGSDRISSPCSGMSTREAITFSFDPAELDSLIPRQTSKVTASARPRLFSASRQRPQ